MELPLLCTMAHLQLLLCSMEKQTQGVQITRHFTNSVLLFLRQRMNLPCMYEQCKHMLMVARELSRLQVSYEEYLCMKTLLLLSTSK